MVSSETGFYCGASYRRRNFPEPRISFACDAISGWIHLGRRGQRGRVGLLTGAMMLALSRERREKAYRFSLAS